MLTRVSLVCALFALGCGGGRSSSGAGTAPTSGGGPSPNYDVDRSGTVDLNDYYILMNVLDGATRDRKNGDYTNFPAANLLVTADVNNDTVVDSNDRTAMEAQGFVTLPATADACVWAFQNSTNYGSASFLDVGVESSNAWESYVHFGNPSQVPSGKTIQEAWLRIWATGKPAGSINYTVAAATSSWTEAGVTYSSRPSVSSTAIGTSTVSALRYDNDPVDVKTTLQGWRSTPSSNFGLALTSTANKIDFRSRDSSSVPAPSIVVRFQ